MSIISDLIKIRDLEKLNYTTDSRGYNLSEGEYVYYYGHTSGGAVQSYLLRTKKYDYAGDSLILFNIEQNSPYYNLDENGYIFRIGTPGEFILLYQAQFRRIGLPSYFDKYDLEHVRLEKERQYKEIMKQNTIRNMEMYDIMGRKLKLGDFVYYIDKPADIHCGVVISTHHIYNEKSEKKSVKGVLLIPEIYLTNKEGVLKQQLSKELNTQVKYKAKESLQRGAVYETSSKYYIYLGRFDFVYSNYMNVTTMITYKHNRDKKYWLEIKKSKDITLKDVMTSNIKNLIKAALEQEVGEMHFYDMLNCLNAVYYKITEFSCFKERVTNRADYKGNYSALFKDELVLTMNKTEKSDYLKSSLHGYKFRFNWID